MLPHLVLALLALYHVDGMSLAVDWGDHSNILDYTVPPSRATIARKSARILSQEEFSQLHEGQGATPVVLTDAIGHWGAMEGKDKWTKNHLIDTVGLEDVDLNVQMGDKVMKTRDALENLLGHLHESTHARAFYTLTEDFLYEVPELMEACGNVSLFPAKDLFDYFPSKLKPSNRAVIIGGRGGISSLHADAYNWTGWNALFGGRKLWRFYPPSTDTSALYVKTQPKMGGLIGSSTSEVNSYATEQTMSHCPEAYPKFGQVAEPQEVIQEAGEVVVIPSGWFHQVYHLTDAIALASQFASRGNLPTILKTMMEYNRITREDCLAAGPFPPLTADLSDVEYQAKAQMAIETVIAAAKKSLKTNMDHPSQVHADQVRRGVLPNGDSSSSDPELDL